MSMYLFYFYAPETHINNISNALFKLGIGKIDNYDCCCWMTKGQGQFRPLANSNPYIGNENNIEKVVEYKIEMVCPDNLKTHAVEVLKKSHPYETPAYGFISIIL